MPKYYCDYCDIFLTHDSSAVRQAHNSGWKHVNQVAAYYRNLPADKIQSVVDTLEHAYQGMQMPELPKVAPPTHDPPQRFGRFGGSNGGGGGRGGRGGRGGGGRGGGRGGGSWRQRSQSPGYPREAPGRHYRQGGSEGYAPQGMQQYGGQHYDRADRPRYSQMPPPPPPPHGPALSAPPQIRDRDRDRDRDSRGRSSGWDR
ncbi:U1 small nuclear ribonucleoprotein C [Coemansia interrupta]|uniref:U1 small nuclear ribonucleoprotein C n=1 Tax=Coemansia interrupta TaxID=1126814 RepID=A0A9W8H7P6_9FUNG|nr:U1 small nuclear ribonucleoprotein C [Coemansia interrupta]